MGLGFRIVKTLDIMLITTIFFFAGFAASRVLDTINTPFNEEKEKRLPLWQTILKVVGMVCITSASIYIIRNLVGLIPSPFEGIYGLEHLKVKEYSASPILAFTLFYYQDHLQDRLRYIYNQIAD